MIPADLDALIENLRQKARGKLNAAGDYWGDWLCEKAAAALVQLRDSEALARGKIAELRTACDASDRKMFPATYRAWEEKWLASEKRAERAEAEVARLKDALRQANGVRDVFASAVVAQAMQDIDPAKGKP